MTDMLVTCSGCGATLDPAQQLAFRCPNHGRGDVDHVLVRAPGGTFPEAGGFAGQNPFIRYRRLSLGYHLALRHGLSDGDYCALVDDLDAAVARVDGQGFRVTPFAPMPKLAEDCGAPEDVDLWVKDETANVSGSHKARHLMGVMIYLQILKQAGLPLAESFAHRRLAIASCGNAALAAAVIARAAEWPLDVFIPPDAEQSVIRRLDDLGAQCQVTRRNPGQSGDPCFLAFLEAVNAGSLGFGVQGSETGLAIEGGQTLGWEMADVLRQSGTTLDVLVVHVGGGALGTACYRGLEEAAAAGVIERAPRLFTVQTTGAYPLKQAFQRFMADGRPADLKSALAKAAQNRSAFMRPWPSEPKSIAHGILDDETYDWLALVEGMAASNGDALVADESRLEEANRLGRQSTGIDVSHTGSAGLAGLMDLFADGRITDGTAAVLFTGAER
jgi:threonine synthase